MVVVASKVTMKYMCLNFEAITEMASCYIITAILFVDVNIMLLRPHVITH